MSENKEEKTDIFLKPGKDFVIRLNNEQIVYYCNSNLCQKYKLESEFYESCRKRTIKRCKDCMTKRVKINKPQTITPEQETVYDRILSQFRIDCHTHVNDSKNIVWKKLDLHVSEIKSLLDWWTNAIKNNEVLKEHHIVNIPSDMYLLLWNECINESDRSIQVNLYDLVPFSKSECRNLRKLPMSMRRDFLQNPQRVEQIDRVLATVKENITKQQQMLIRELNESFLTPTIVTPPLVDE